MHTTYRIKRFQENGFFETEIEAKSFLIDRIKQMGLQYKEEHPMKGVKYRLDLVINVEGVFIPIEVKKKLFGKQLYDALQQANSYIYSMKNKRPIFIGPFLRPHNSPKLDKEYKLLANSMARFNIGFIYCDYYCTNFFLGEKPIIYFDRGYKLRTNLDHYLYRNALGSRKIASKVET